MVNFPHHRTQRLDDRFLGGIVLHTGQAGYSLGERIHAAPISTLWT